MHDTGRSFEPIFMKITRLGRVHPWMILMAFGNNQPGRTIDIGENVPQTSFFGLNSDGMGFFEGKT